MQKEYTKDEILGLMAKFRSRLDILWRIITRICEGSFPSSQIVGGCQQYDIPLQSLAKIDFSQIDNIYKPTYEEAAKVAFETVMADFYRIEALIEESF